MTVPEIYRVLLLMLGIEDPAAAVESVQIEMLACINKALQMLAAGGEEFHLRTRATVTLSAGQQAYVLGKEVQRVLENPTLEDGSPLRKLTSWGQLQNFGQLFLGQLDNNVASGKPIAYFVESRRDTTEAEADSVKIEVHFLPRPDAGYAGTDVQLDVIEEPTPVALEDLEDDDAVLRIPDKYVESVFVPLAKWNATSSPYFIQKELITRYKEDFDGGMRLLTGLNPDKTQARGSRYLEAPAQPEAKAA